MDIKWTSVSHTAENCITGIKNGKVFPDGVRCRMKNGLNLRIIFLAEKDWKERAMSEKTKLETESGAGKTVGWNILHEFLKQNTKLYIDVGIDKDCEAEENDD